MKKLFMVIMALLCAGSVFAQEEKKGPDFKYSIKGAAFGVTGSQEDFGYDYSHIRVRPTFTAVNDNVSAVVTFEVDQDYGKKSDDSGADAGTDNKVVEVKHAYLAVKDTAGVKGLSLMAGLNGYKFPLVVDNDFAMVSAGYDFGMGKAVVSYIKVEEMDTTETDAAGTDDKDDIDVYALDLPLKFGDITVRPGVMMIKGGEQATLPEMNLANYALNVNAKMGMVGFDVTGAYLKGDVSSTVSTSAYALDAIVNVKPVENLKINVFFTYASGNDGSAADEDNGYLYNMNQVFGKNETSATAGKSSSGVTDGRLFLLEFGYASAARDGGIDYYDVMDSDSGYMSYGISAEFKMDKLTAFAQFGMASYVEEDANGDKALGSELDLKLTYEVASRTDLFVEYATIIAGDVALGQYTDAKGAYQAAFGLTTKI